MPSFAFGMWRSAAARQAQEKKINQEKDKMNVSHDTSSQSHEISKPAEKPILAVNEPGLRSML